MKLCSSGFPASCSNDLLRKHYVKEVNQLLGTELTETDFVYSAPLRLCAKIALNSIWLVGWLVGWLVCLSVHQRKEGRKFGLSLRTAEPPIKKDLEKF